MANLKIQAQAELAIKLVQEGVKGYEAEQKLYFEALGKTVSAAQAAQITEVVKNTIKLLKTTTIQILCQSLTIKVKDLSVNYIHKSENDICGTILIALSLNKHFYGSISLKEDMVVMAYNEMVESVVTAKLKEGLEICVITKNLNFLKHLPIIVDWAVIKLPVHPILLIVEGDNEMYLVSPYKGQTEEAAIKGLEICSIVEKDGNFSCGASAILYDQVLKVGMAAHDFDKYPDTKVSRETEKLRNIIVNILIAHQGLDSYSHEEKNVEYLKIKERIARGYKVKKQTELLKKQQSIKYVDISLFLDKPKMRKLYRQTRPDGEPLFTMRPHLRKEHTRVYVKTDTDTGEVTRKIVTIAPMGIKGFDMAQLKELTVVEVLKP